MNATQQPDAFLHFSGDLTQAIVGEALPERHIIIEPDDDDPSQGHWRLSQQAQTLATVDHESGGLCAGAIKTLICKDEARPTNQKIPAMLQKGVETIILEDGHENILDTAAFPNLQAIVCKDDDITYAATYLDRAGCNFSDSFEMEETIHQQQAEIHSQLLPQLPKWMKNLVIDPACRIELSFRVILDFRTHEEAAIPVRFYWDGEQLQEEERPLWSIPACILYSWRAGRPYWAVPSPGQVGRAFSSASSSSGRVE